MAIAAYSDLKTKAASWLRRSGNSTYVSEVPDLITFCEGKLNTELGPVETEATLTGTIGSRSLDISSLTVLEPLALFLTPGTGIDEIKLDQQSPHDLNFAATSAEPNQWSYDSNSTIKLDSPCLEAYSFRFRYKGAFHLSDSTTTNWLLETRPDVYLAAALGWGSAYLENFQNSAVWQAYLDRELPKVRRMLEKQRRGTLRVDPALLVTSGTVYNIETDA